MCVDYRVKDLDVRLEYFIKYFKWSLKFYDADPSLFLLNYINNRMELNIEQRYWMAWLYGNTYQLATSWVIANEFPDFENVDEDRLEWWNSNNYSRLRYQKDQKWQKGHLPIMFKSYKSNVINCQERFFNSICSDLDKYTNFDNLFNYITNNFYKFGRYSTWFYIQTLKETCGLNVEPRYLLLDNENTHTQRDGLCFALGKDEWVGDKFLHKDKIRIGLLNEASNFIVDTIKNENPELGADMFMLETVLCAFKKTFRIKNGRYLGYYLDRQYEDIKKVEDDGWLGIDWNLLWDGRREILNISVNNETGVRKEDMEYFLKTGKIKYYELYENDFRK